MDIILENSQPRPAVDNVVIFRGKEDNVGSGVFQRIPRSKKYYKMWMTNQAQKIMFIMFITEVFSV